ncbi:translation initiation factor IF-3 [Candidatus Kryptobacter tengchongensis]|nr:translation initiation factor IF-3 [Candidatus Kryptobacter tengchongensis]
MIDENGQSLGIMNTRDALRLAEERGYDLVEVAPNANPPVCRLMDYGKYKYESNE